MNIVLVGYRGTGKTAVAALLAQRLGLGVVHLDAEIERRAGQDAFRRSSTRSAGPVSATWRRRSCARCAARDGLVLDCGGGVIERDANFAVLRQAGPVIWLKASVATIVQRIRGDSQRPSLTGKQSFTEEVAEVLERRTPRYRPDRAPRSRHRFTHAVDKWPAEIERLLQLTCDLQFVCGINSRHTIRSAPRRYSRPCDRTGAAQHGIFQQWRWRLASAVPVPPLRPPPAREA